MTLKTWCDECRAYHAPHDYHDPYPSLAALAGYPGPRIPPAPIGAVFLSDVPEVNPLAYVVKEQCSQCHRLVLETVSGVCLDCDYVNRVTASKPA